MEKDKDLISSSNSEWDESKHNRDEMGRFAEKEREETKSLSMNVKMTPEEKIASIHIDFSKDNILPELNESELEKVGAKTNKSILLKKSVIDRNRAEHSDITDNDFEQIVAKALYAPSEVFPANKDKPYYHFAKVVEVNSKGKPEIGLALLDVDDTKDNFEVVHAHFVGTKAFEREKKKD